VSGIDSHEQGLLLRRGDPDSGRPVKGRLISARETPQAPARLFSDQGNMTP
jgi:hypothetical protein